MAGHVFNTLMGGLDSPVIIVTTADERERAGCLVEFHGQSSIEPRRYCVWLSKANYTYRVALYSSHLVIHFLTADDLPLAELFGQSSFSVAMRTTNWADLILHAGGRPGPRRLLHYISWQ